MERENHQINQFQQLAAITFKGGVKEICSYHQILRICLFQQKPSVLIGCLKSDSANSRNGFYWPENDVTVHCGHV